MLCSVVNHAGSGRARKKCRRKDNTQSSVFPPTSWVLYGFLIALQQSRTQSMLLYLFKNKEAINIQRIQLHFQTRIQRFLVQRNPAALMLKKTWHFLNGNYETRSSKLSDELNAKFGVVCWKEQQLFTVCNRLKLDFPDWVKGQTTSADSWLYRKHAGENIRASCQRTNHSPDERWCEFVEIHVGEVTRDRL